MNEQANDSYPSDHCTCQNIRVFTKPVYNTPLVLSLKPINMDHRPPPNLSSIIFLTYKKNIFSPKKALGLQVLNPRGMISFPYLT